MLLSTLSRPFITKKKLLEIAEEENASAIAHGCNSRDKNHVCFEDLVKELNSNIEVLAPARDGIGREKKKSLMQKRTVFRFQLMFKQTGANSWILGFKMYTCSPKIVMKKLRFSFDEIIK